MMRAGFRWRFPWDRGFRNGQKRNWVKRKAESQNHCQQHHLPKLHEFGFHVNFQGALHFRKNKSPGGSSSPRLTQVFRSVAGFGGKVSKLHMGGW